jgi:hypothetical protein
LVRASCADNSDAPANTGNNWKRRGPSSISFDPLPRQVRLGRARPPFSSVLGYRPNDLQIGLPWSTARACGSHVRFGTRLPVVHTLADLVLSIRSSLDHAALPPGCPARGHADRSTATASNAFSRSSAGPGRGTICC